MNPFISRHRGRISVFLLNGALVTGGLVFPATCCRTAFGAEVELLPSCAFKEEFNDNVFPTAVNRKSDFITTLAPALAFSRKTERLKLDLLTGLSRHDYARSEGIHTMDYRFNARMANKLTVRDDMGLSAAYSRSTRPDDINQSTGLTTGTSSGHYQYSANAGRAIDETTSASLTYSFVKDTYDNPALLANHVHYAALVVSKDLDAVLPLLKGTLGTDFSRGIYRDSTSDNYVLRVGASRNINEKFKVNLSVGGQLVHSTFVTTSEVDNDSWGAVGSALINYTGEKGFGSLSFAHNFSAASGQVGAVEATSFGLTLGKRLSYRTTAQVAASYNINRASSGQFSSRSADDRALSLKADIVYNTSKFIDIGFQYAYYVADHNVNNLQVTQNSVMLRVVAKYPITR